MLIFGCYNAPVAEKILNEVIQYLGLEPTEEIMEKVKKE